MADNGKVFAQTSCQFKETALCCRDAHFLLRVERHIVHSGLCIVAIFAPRRGVAQVVVVGAASAVVRARPLGSRHEQIPHAAKLVAPIGLQFYGIVERL